MGNRFDRLPKGVQKLVKRLANIEREQLKTLRAGYPEERWGRSFSFRNGMFGS